METMEIMKVLASISFITFGLITVWAVVADINNTWK